MDMTNFLTKESFILERVKTFVGNSELNLARINTFKEVMKEIDASLSVELDFMIHKRLSKRRLSRTPSQVTQLLP